jgi:hypothetical protein
MIKKNIQIGLMRIQVVAVDGVGTIRTAEHKQTKAIYDMIKKRMLQNLDVNLHGDIDVQYSERMNCIFEHFPNMKEQDIMDRIENDIKDKDKIVDEVKRKAEQAIKNKGK